MNEPSEREVRLRLIEAAAKAPIVHNNGPAVGVVEVAQTWEAYVLGHLKPGIDDLV